MKHTALAVTGVALTLLLFDGCALPRVAPTGDGRLSRAELAELWVDPGPNPRNLEFGVGGNHPRPEPDAQYEVIEKDTRGFSITYRVRDSRGAEWNVKIGPEAQTEVVASRLLWALGYHQLPSYFVERWIAVDNARGQLLGGARFRPRDLALQSKGIWSWQANPFVGTREYNGLLSVLMLINSTDLKNDNNEIYEVEGEPRERARRWYIVKDLGASFGETGRVDPRRGYLEGFEREPFLEAPSDRYARFAFRGRHQELLRRIPVVDLQWACQRVLAVTDRQWRDAFRAGNYDELATERYVARIRSKAQEGLGLR
ncbi:MAG TPA: hypothetical protein VM032_12405 [Vicinamibacterales bacterium]|nr:hypothetical protein [Vicinamibacterales bacterium]